MKKLLLASLAALALGSAITAAAAEKPRTITIGLIAKSQGNPVFQAARVGAVDAAKELGAKHKLTIKIDWRTPNEEDAQKQAEAIEQLVLTGAEGIAGALNVPPGEGFGTVCSSLVALGADGARIWRFIAGPPRARGYAPVALPAEE